VAADIDHRDLVVALGLTDGHGWRATYHGWQTTTTWTHRRDVGKRPAELPPRFVLVTALFGVETPFPYQRVDRYGWHWTFGAFPALVVLVFAHECFHAMGGPDWRDEAAANRWALAHVRRLGFAVEGAAPPRVKEPLMDSAHLHLLLVEARATAGELLDVAGPLTFSPRDLQALAQSLLRLVDTCEGLHHWGLSWMVAAARREQGRGPALEHREPVEQTSLLSPFLAT